MERLTESNIAQCQEEFDLTYHVPYAYHCLKLLGFENKDVLEVGGSLPEKFVFKNLGARSWTALESPEYEESLAEAGGLTHKGTLLKKANIDIVQGFQTPLSKPYLLNIANVEDLPVSYNSSFDLIFSIATFEHISKMPQALNRMYKALKQGGSVFIHSCPIWSSHDGHHLPKIKDKNNIEWGGKNPIIPPWGHLYLTPPKMMQYLQTKTDFETASLMIYYIYNSPFINRLFFEDFTEFVQQTPFIEKKVDGIYYREVPGEFAKYLNLLYPCNRNFQCNGIQIVLKK